MFLHSLQDNAPPPRTLILGGDTLSSGGGRGKHSLGSIIPGGGAGALSLVRGGGEVLFLGDRRSLTPEEGETLSLGGGYYPGEIIIPGRREPYPWYGDLILGRGRVEEALSL